MKTAAWKLFHGDCRDELQNIPDDSIDLIVTSPPYANQRASTYGGVKPAEYVDWFLPISAELRRTLKPTGSFVLNIKEPAVNSFAALDKQRNVIGIEKQTSYFEELQKNLDKT